MKHWVANAASGASAGGIVAAASGAGWIGLILVVALASLFVGALCWVLADKGRTNRLTSLFKAWHQG